MFVPSPNRTNERTLTTIVTKMSILTNYRNIGNKFGNWYKGGYLLTRATTVTKVTTRTKDNHAKYSSLRTHKYPQVSLKRASFHPTLTKNTKFIQLSVFVNQTGGSRVPCGRTPGHCEMKLLFSFCNCFAKAPRIGKNVAVKCLSVLVRIQNGSNSVWRGTTMMRACSFIDTKYRVLFH